MFAGAVVRRARGVAFARDEGSEVLGLGGLAPKRAATGCWRASRQPDRYTPGNGRRSHAMRCASVRSARPTRRSRLEPQSGVEECDSRRIAPRRGSSKASGRRWQRQDSCNIGLRCRPQAERSGHLPGSADARRGPPPFPDRCHRADCLHQEVLGDQHGVERGQPEIGKCDRRRLRPPRPSARARQGPCQSDPQRTRRVTRPRVRAGVRHPGGRYGALPARSSPSRYPEGGVRTNSTAAGDNPTRHP